MTLKMVFWDVQHGDAAYLNTPDDSHIVQDLGTGSYEDKNEDFSPLHHLQRKYGIDRIDHAILTHPHTDHIADVKNLMDVHPRVLTAPSHLSRDAIMDDILERDKEIVEEYLDIVDRYSSSVSYSDSPTNPDNNGGVDIKTFTPKESSESNLNNHSVVTVASYAGSTILMSGDNESPSWNELLDRASFRNAIDGTDILLASHHGRKSGFHSDLFDYITPRLTIISDGRFGDTSATDRYSSVSEGWTVHKRSGGKVERNCVTTRSDGVIVVKFGHNGENPFIHVKID
jgi:beta-lactamase superfamily II metal-dependent hydrolase